MKAASILAAFAALCFTPMSNAQSGMEPPIDKGHAIAQGFSPWNQPPVRPGIGPDVAGFNGPDDDLGTVPTVSSGGSGGGGASSAGDVDARGGPGGAQQHPSRNDPGAPPAVVGPCGHGGAGGTNVAVDCSAQGDVFVDGDGDAHAMNGTNAGIVLGAADDTAFVGQDAVVGVLGSGGSVDASNGWGSSVYVTCREYPNEVPMVVSLPGGGTLPVEPGESFFRTFPQKPKV